MTLPGGGTCPPLWRFVWERQLSFYFSFSSHPRRFIPTREACAPFVSLLLLAFCWVGSYCSLHTC